MAIIKHETIKKPQLWGLVCMTDALTQSCFFNAGYSRLPQKHTLKLYPTSYHVSKYAYSNSKHSSNSAMQTFCTTP
jgi:hypothetical protein